MGLREFMQNGTAPQEEQTEAASQSPEIAGDEISDEQILKLAEQYFPQMPPEQVFDVIQQLKESLGKDVSTVDLLGVIFKYMKERQGGTSRFQDLAGKMKR